MAIKTGTRQLGLQPGAAVSSKSRVVAPREMRCPGCGTKAIEAADGEGGKLLRCPNCRREFTFSRM